MSRDTRFEILEKEGINIMTTVKVIIDKETGVNYLFVQAGYGGGLTPLLDSKGNPIVSK